MTRTIGEKIRTGQNCVRIMEDGCASWCPLRCCLYNSTHSKSKSSHFHSHRTERCGKFQDRVCFQLRQSAPPWKSRTAPAWLDTLSVQCARVLCQWNIHSCPKFVQSYISYKHFTVYWWFLQILSESYLIDNLYCTGWIYHYILLYKVQINILHWLNSIWLVLWHELLSVNLNDFTYIYLLYFCTSGNEKDTTLSWLVVWKKHKHSKLTNHQIYLITRTSWVVLLKLVSYLYRHTKGTAVTSTVDDKQISRVKNVTPSSLQFVVCYTVYDLLYHWRQEVYICNSNQMKMKEWSCQS